jgi:hypothetical protein
MKPGAYALTVMLCFPHSRAAVWVSARTPNFEIQYAAEFAMPDQQKAEIEHYTYN